MKYIWIKWKNLTAPSFGLPSVMIKEAAAVKRRNKKYHSLGSIAINTDTNHRTVLIKSNMLDTNRAIITDSKTTITPQRSTDQNGCSESYDAEEKKKKGKKQKHSSMSKRIWSLEQISFFLLHVLLPFWQLIESIFRHPKYDLKVLIREIGLQSQTEQVNIISKTDDEVWRHSQMTNLSSLKINSSYWILRFSPQLIITESTLTAFTAILILLLLWFWYRCGRTSICFLDFRNFLRTICFRKCLFTFCFSCNYSNVSDSQRAIYTRLGPIPNKKQIYWTGKEEKTRGENCKEHHQEW